MSKNPLQEMIEHLGDIMTHDFDEQKKKMFEIYTIERLRDDFTFNMGIVFLSLHLRDEIGKLDKERVNLFLNGFFDSHRILFSKSIEDMIPDSLSNYEQQRKEHAEVATSAMKQFRTILESCLAEVITKGE